MQLYLEQPATALFWEITWSGTTVTERTGALGEQGQQQQQHYSTTVDAFQGWITAARAKIEAGYQDPEGKVKREQLDVVVYEQYLQNQQYDAAMAWLGYFGHLDDSEWEDKLVAHYLEKEDYTAAEKYVLGKLQRSQEANVVVRQIRYLATINPMLCRFMLGNLPVTVNAERPAAYYRELASAQSKIAFFDLLSTQLRAIKAPEHQLLYLTHLLDTPHDQHPQQIVAIDKAQAILNNWQTSISTKKAAYKALIKGAERIGQTTTAAELKIVLQALPEEEE